MVWQRHYTGIMLLEFIVVVPSFNISFKISIIREGDLGSFKILDLIFSMQMMTSYNLFYLRRL